ncbi:putative zinc-binding oxidoreductase protein [Neofusicoccum parvum UCRNP2]|uniref:Putative zinc-binding oxidoreductase protein n=1 Tax=Botryosphaeria parva (strain UCR-NP2) TaxID=1287680 RepID=R1EZ53_BOTPV|nr:putative zinc-binding oxidoreductase protein [Neofusicoccum parvum UCRNP2]
MPPTNRAAWLTGKQVRPLEVKSAPYTKPGQNEIVVQARAIAVNPVDAMKQAMGDMMMGWIKYPFILGDDLAGDVVEVGPGVTRFQPGDRVVGHAVSIDKRSNRACEGAFQEYVVLRTNLVSPIPDSMSYETACVLPLCLSTASCGLFMQDFLALQHPTPKTPRNSTGKTLLVWGGSTSLGSNAIQLAVAAGYEVITTASPKNFDYVTKLGASKVFDYRSPATVGKIIAALKGKPSAGAIAIGDGSMEACIEIVAASEGRKFISQASVPMPEEIPPKGFGLVSFIASFLWFNVSTFVKCKAKGIGAKFIWGDDLMANEVGSAIYEHFLPDALASGKYVAAPEPYVVGKGLEHIQEALDVVKKGVSARKVVVTL